jgi:protein-S-isoprenylcysteine O-methyltransferase Ste14
MTPPVPSPVPANLALRATAAFIALPGVVAIVAPLLIARFTTHPPGFARAGVVELVLGVVVLLWCTRAFYVSGRGTLAPWAPPTALVREGLYQWSRNPMYLGVLLMLAGWALGFRSSMLWIYAAVVALAFHLRVVLGEEPFLARRYGDDWQAYRKRVPRWLL